MGSAMRIFDVDFAEIVQTLSRVSTPEAPGVQVSGVTYGDVSQQQLVFEDDVGGALFHEAVDLSQLTIEGRTFQPLQIIVNRPYTVPRGTKLNPNISVQNEEYFFIWYTNVAKPVSSVKQTFIQALRRAGMNTSPTVGLDLETHYEEQQPDLGQLLWASQSSFLPSLDTALSVANGMIVNEEPIAIPHLPITITNSMRRVDSSEWGSMAPVQGPMLHFFRLVTNYSQNMGGVPLTSPIVLNSGFDTQHWSPVNIKIVCEEVNLSSEEYLTTAFNTLTRMNPAGPN